MKSIILIFFIITLIITHSQGEMENKTHIFLVKTALSKEQVETLLSQYQHQNNNMNQEGTTTLVHHNSTTTLVENNDKTQLNVEEHEQDPNHRATQLKVKKEKHQKKQEAQEIVPEVSEDPETEVEKAEQINLEKSKKGKK